MKKNLWLVLITLFVMTISAVVPSGIAAYAADESEAPVMVLTATTSGKEVTVDAALKRNSGISGLTVEIVYDASAMTLINVERGSALSSLEYLTTNVATGKGYAVTPFMIIWSGDDNDVTTGTVVRMRFLVKETAPDGDYPITLRGDGNNSVTYVYQGRVESKRILVDGVKIRLKGNVPEAVDPASEEEPEAEKPNIALIVSLSVVGSAVLAGGIVFIVLELKKQKKQIKQKKKGKKGKETWEKVE